jgi:hypothetical protein
VFDTLRGRRGTNIAFHNLRVAVMMSTASAVLRRQYELPDGKAVSLAAPAIITTHFKSNHAWKAVGPPQYAETRVRRVPRLPS